MQSWILIILDTWISLIYINEKKNFRITAYNYIRGYNGGVNEALVTA